MIAPLLVGGKDTPTLIDGESLVSIERDLVDAAGVFVHEADDTSSRLTGSTAWPGFAKGPAKVVKEEADIARVKEGDILVTVMTFPNYVPAMEKAAAFVTDEGGILCHAAIVAREMNKPCVIATKHATRIIKDYDVVEVDAGRGTVTIASTDQ